MKASGPLLAMVGALALATACGDGGQPTATPTVTAAPTEGPTTAPSPTATVGAPAADKIAFVSTLEGNPEIYVMNADGSAQTRLTHNPVSDGGPAWSPDGSRIAFMSAVEGANTEIYVINTDGSDLSRLTNNTASDAFPAWSLDGSRIAFVSNRDGNFEIYVMNADGSAQTNITGNPAIDMMAAWSPVQ